MILCSADKVGDTSCCVVSINSAGEHNISHVCIFRNGFKSDTFRTLCNELEGINVLAFSAFQIGSSDYLSEYVFLPFRFPTAVVTHISKKPVDRVLTFDIEKLWNIVAVSILVHLVKASEYRLSEVLTEFKVVYDLLREAVFTADRTADNRRIYLCVKVSIIADVVKNTL